ncbi:MAG: hypothetical protein ABW157_05880 [Candidatus Thiodiazotropha sp. LLP2]
MKIRYSLWNLVLFLETFGRISVKRRIAVYQDLMEKVIYGEILKHDELMVIKTGYSPE